MLHNPRYAGAFFYGRHRQLPGPTGTPQTISISNRSEWISFIPNIHPGYITLDTYNANQDRLAECATAHGSDRTRGPAREGPALLQGIAICGICGRRMTVRYHTRRGQQYPDYVCQHSKIEHGEPICQHIPGAHLDAAISHLLITTLTPLTIEAALTVEAELAHQAEAADHLRAAAVHRAQYLTDLARRRYLAVDPANRLVADTLEADYNTALRDLATAQDTYNTSKHTTTTLTQTQKARLHQLTTDLPAIFNDPATPHRERKRIARLLLTDVTITRTATTLTCHIRFSGGQTHTLTLPTAKSACQLRTSPPHIVTAIDQLLDHHTHTEIADILNTRGLLNVEGRPFHHLMIRNIRDAYGLRSRYQRLRDTGLLTLTEIADHLHVSTSTVKQWRNAGLITAQRYNDRGETLYHPPGPNPPTKQQGHRLTDRRPAQTPEPSRST